MAPPPLPPRRARARVRTRSAAPAPGCARASPTANRFFEGLLERAVARARSSRSSAFQGRQATSSQQLATTRRNMPPRLSLPPPRADHSRLFELERTRLMETLNNSLDSHQHQQLQPVHNGKPPSLPKIVSAPESVSGTALVGQHYWCDEETVRYVVEVENENEHHPSHKHLVAGVVVLDLESKNINQQVDIKGKNGVHDDNSDDDDDDDDDVILQNYRAAGKKRFNAEECIKRRLRSSATASVDSGATASRSGFAKDSRTRSRSPRMGVIATPNTPVNKGPTRSNDPRALQCLLCGVEYSSRQAARKHILNVHVRELQDAAAAPKDEYGVAEDAEDESGTSIPLSSDSAGSSKKLEAPKSTRRSNTARL